MAGKITLTLFFTIIVSLVVLYFWWPEPTAGNVGFAIIVSGGIVSLIVWVLNKFKKK